MKTVCEKFLTAVLTISHKQNFPDSNQMSTFDENN